MLTTHLSVYIYCTESTCLGYIEDLSGDKEHHKSRNGTDLVSFDEPQSTKVPSVASEEKIELIRADLEKGDSVVPV